MFSEISKEDIENIENNIKNGFCNYKLKGCEFSTDTFKEGSDITIIQLIADEEIELVFKTKEENGKYYISSAFEIIKDDVIYGTEAMDVFQSVRLYYNNVINNEDKDFAEEKESLIKFLLLTEEYDEEKLKVDLDPDNIRQDYKQDYERIYSDDNLNRIQKSLALKELVHMAICQIVNDIDLFFTRPVDLTPEENSEKNRQEAKALENELKFS